jgi:tRNA(Ile)-lysidine synthase
MLGITHAEAVAFLKAHGLRWREDISNNSDEHLRNRVRHKILPLMEELLNPNIRATLCRTAEILNEEEAWLNELAHEEFSNRLVDETCELKLDNFFSQATAMRRRILLLWLFHNQLPANILDFNTVCVLDKLSLSLDGTKRMSVGGGWSAVRRYARLGLERESSGNAPIEPMRLNVPGETFHSGLGITVLAKYYQGVIKESGKRIGEMPSTATISAVTVGNDEIFVRSWQAGDYMRSYGLGGSKKLQDIFTDQKIPADHRSFIPVFECRGDIIWIPGYRIATDWAVPDGDSPSLLMEVHRKELPA